MAAVCERLFCQWSAGHPRVRRGFFITGQDWIGRKSRPNFRRPRARGWGSWGGSSKPSPHHLGFWVSAVSSSNRVRGGALTVQRFPTIFNTQDGLSWYYNIVNCGLSCSQWGGGKKPVTPLAYTPPDIDSRRGGDNVCASRPSWHAPFAAVPLRCALYSVTRIDIFGTWRRSRTWRFLSCAWRTGGATYVYTAWGCVRQAWTEHDNVRSGVRTIDRASIFTRVIDLRIMCLCMQCLCNVDHFYYRPTFINEKSAQRRRKHCTLAVVRRIQKNFAPPQTFFPGARDGQNLISWRWSLLHLQTHFVRIDARNFELSW